MIGNVNEGEVDLMELIIVEVHHYKIKKQNSKMYYTTSTEQFKYFKWGFLQGYKNKKNIELFVQITLVSAYF